MQCPICNFKIYVYLEDMGKKYYKCEECEFIFLHREYILGAKEEMQRYALHQNNIGNKGYVEMFNCFIDKIILSQKKRIQTALDFGCGPGPVLAELLKRRGIETDIYDIYFAPKKVYKNKQYDLITSTEVFEHLASPLIILQKMEQLLSIGGIIALMTVFHPQVSNTFKSWWYRRDPTHISFYVQKTFEVLANRVGLKLIYCDNKKNVVLSK